MCKTARQVPGGTCKRYVPLLNGRLVQCRHQCVKCRRDEQGPVQGHLGQTRSQCFLVRNKPIRSDVKEKVEEKTSCKEEDSSGPSELHLDKPEEEVRSDNQGPDHLDGASQGSPKTLKQANRDLFLTCHWTKSKNHSSAPTNFSMSVAKKCVFWTSVQPLNGEDLHSRQGR